MASPQQLDFSSVLSESKRIINAHSRHFLALSVLFLLPLSFSVTVYSTVHNLLLHRHPSGHPPKSLLSKPPPLLPRLNNFNSLHHHHHHNFSPDDDDLPFPVETLALAAGFALFLSIYTNLALGSITYSVLHGFYGRPVKLISAVKSALTSFLRLLFTHLLIDLMVSLITLLFICSLYFVTKGLNLLGLEIYPNSSYFIALAVIYSALWLIVLLYFKINWILSSVVVVAESSWGIFPLKRSSYLVRGMQRAVLYFLLSFGILSGVLTWTSSIAAAKLSGGGGGEDGGWNSWFFVAQIVVTSALLTLLLLYFFAAQSVLYMFCKAVRGELASEIVQEFATEYVCLPFDNEKVPRLVSVVYT